MSFKKKIRNKIYNYSCLIFVLFLSQSCSGQSVNLDAKTSDIDSLSNYLNLDTCITLLELAKLEEQGANSDSLMIEYEKRSCNCYYAEYWGDKLHQTGYILDCEQNGKWVEYINGRKSMMITTFKNGKRNGEFLSYRYGGQLVLRCHYVDDKYHGKLESWDNKGELVEEIYYDLGRVVKKDVKKHWQPDGVKTYLFEVESFNSRNHTNLEKPGAYIWDNGELVIFKEWTQEEVKNRKADFNLIKKAQVEYYKDKK